MTISPQLQILFGHQREVIPKIINYSNLFLRTVYHMKDECTIPEIGKCFVENYLMTLPTNKTVGPDRVCSRILRITAPLIAPTVTRILPMQWKLSRICLCIKAVVSLIKTSIV